MRPPHAGARVGLCRKLQDSSHFRACSCRSARWQQPCSLAGRGTYPKHLRRETHTGQRTRPLARRGHDHVERALGDVTAGLAPSIGDYVDDARRVRAASDVQVLASTFARFTFDVPVDRSLKHGWASAELLVGPGDAPVNAEGSDPAWAAGIDGTRVGRLEDHLMVNTPGYPARQSGPRYAARGWRGSYLSGLTPDPLGPPLCHQRAQLHHHRLRHDRDLSGSERHRRNRLRVRWHYTRR